MKTFRIGGVHPAENKLSAGKAIETLALPKQAVFPLSQHIGAPATPIVQVGDAVYSSGTGSVYPADLKIGTVTAIEVDEYNRTLVATVTPAVDFSSLKWVMVITGYQNGGGDK